MAFAAALNVAVRLAGPTITSLVATLYAVLATLFAVPLLGERIQPSQIAALAVALIGTVLRSGFDPLHRPQERLSRAIDRGSEGHPVEQPAEGILVESAPVFPLPSRDGANPFGLGGVAADTGLTGRCA